LYIYTHFEKILGKNNSTYVRDRDTEYDQDNVYVVNNDNENNIQPENTDIQPNPDLRPRVNQNNENKIKNEKNNKNNYQSDNIHLFMPYNNKNFPESTLNNMNENKMHPYTKKNEVLEQKLINNLNFKSNFSNDIYVPPSLYNKNEYDILLGMYVCMFCYICSFSLFAWLFFFTYALSVVVYVSHVEDRFFNTPCL
jgi:hypothetical protein